MKLILLLSENWTMIRGDDLRGQVRMAIEAEPAGFDGVMVSEHIVLGPSANENGLPANPRAFVLPGNQDPATPWPSSIVLLSAIAAATSRIRIIAGAVIAPLRHPLLLARELGSLDLLSEGRLVVLPTVSWHRDEYAALGVPFHQRGEILDETLAAWSVLWRGSPASFQGRHFSFSNIWFEPAASRPTGPTLWFGGQAAHPRMARRLARYGSGWLPLGPATPADVQAVATAMNEEGRSIDELEIVGGMTGIFRDATGVASLDEALAQVAPQAASGVRAVLVKPSQFIDHADRFPEFAREIVAKVKRLEPAGR